MIVARLFAVASLQDLALDNISSLTSLNAGTVMAWVWLTDLNPSSTGRGVLVLGGPGTGAAATVLSLNLRSSPASGQNTRIDFTWINTTSTIRGFSGNTNLAANTWHHVAWVQDGSAVAMYVDGVAQSFVDWYGAGTSTGAWMNDLNSPDRGHIGSGYYDGAQVAYFNGRIAEVAIHSVALTAAQVASAAAGYSAGMIRRDALVHSWRLWTGDGNRDWHAKNNGTARNSPTDAQHPRIIYPTGVF